MFPLCGCACYILMKLILKNAGLFWPYILLSFHCLYIFWKILTVDDIAGCVILLFPIDINSL